MERILITGAAGRIATALRPRLRREGRILVLTDRTAPADDVDPRYERFVEAEVTDGSAMTSVARGATSVVHLAGFPSERSWEDLDRVNVGGTVTVLEAARATGTGSVLLASSIHAAGYATGAEAGEDPPVAARPDSYYGVTKAAMELLGALYSDRFSMTVVSARLADFAVEPSAGERMALWLSPADMARLVEAAARLRTGRHHLVWGVSANSGGWLPLGPGHRIGFDPADDASEHFRRRREVAPEVPDAGNSLGGVFREHPLGVPFE